MADIMMVSKLACPRTIVLLTGGMELNTSFAAYEKDNDREMQQLRQQIAEVSDEMVREANGANFTVHIINARSRGMAAPQHDVENHSSGMTGANLLRNLMNDPIDVADVDSIPLSIALGTGGMYLPSNDIRGSLQRIDALTSTFYSLGYSPEHNGDRQYHTIIKAHSRLILCGGAATADDPRPARPRAVDAHA